MAWTVNLNNSQFNTLVSADISDGSFSYQEMLNLLSTVAVGGITSSEWADLKTVYTNSAAMFASDYLKNITYDVIYGNPANAKWWGGTTSFSSVALLGNMSDTTSQQNANHLIDKWFLGLDLPMPIAGGDSATGTTAKYVFNYSLATGALFVNGAVAADVNQGKVGDCYLVASLGAIANASSSLISNSFIDNGNGTYGVKFYLNGAATYTTVNKSLPIDNSGQEGFGGNLTKSSSGELWVSLFEKAYVQLNAQANIQGESGWLGENSYQAISGGWAFPIKEITGLNYKYYTSYYQSLPDPFDSGEFYSASASTYKQTIINALNAGSIGWLGSFGNTSDAANGKQDFVAGHAFMLLGYDTATDKFIFRNPWGGSGSSYYNPQFEASIDTFWNSSVKGVVAISDPTIKDPVFNYTIVSSAATAGNAVSEGVAVTFTITRDSSGSASTVYLSTASGSADASDYQTATKSLLSFAANETSKTVTVNTYTDSLTEGAEYFNLNLYKQLADTTSAATATGWVKDTTVQDYTYSIASSANLTGIAVAEGGAVTFTITRSGSGSASTVYLSTAAATAGVSDYAALDKFAYSFAAYETVKSVTVNTYQDSIAEGNEYFSLDLYKSFSDTSKAATSLGYIKDQPLPSFTYDVQSNAGSAATAVGEGGKVTFTITRSGSGVATTVYVATAYGSAGASDLAGVSNKAITFAANEKVATLDVDINQDWWLEGTEYFSLNVYKNQSDSVSAGSGSAFIKDGQSPLYNYTISSDADTSGTAVTEGGAVTFTITRSGSGSASTVYLSTIAGTAGSSDYQALDKSAVSFASYETSKTVIVNANTDSLTEGTEYFWLDLYRNYSDSTYSAYSAAYIKDAVVTDYSYSITSDAGTSSTAVVEGGSVTFTITRSGSGSATTVYWGTQGGTATAGGGDYQSPGIATLNFAAYETSKTVTVSTNTDTLVEGTEYFWLNLYKTYTDATNFAYSSYGTGYIKDAVVTDYSYSISNDAGASSTAVTEGGAVTFTITRSGSGSASTAYLSTYAGTAGASDYQALDKSALNFAAYETSKTVTVNANTDSLKEGTEYFFLELFKTYSDATNFKYASYSMAYIKDAVVTDYSYSITSNAGTSSTAVTEGGTVTFTITRSGSGSATTVYWGTQGGTATAGGGDYQSLGISTLSFAANETSKTVTVSTNTDTLVEGTEYFWLNLYKTYTDATNFAYSSYGTAYIKDAVVTDYGYTISNNASTTGTAVAEGGTATFTITRSGSGSASTVYVSTLAGTASASDYAALDKSAINFSASETVKTVTVTTNTDSLKEGTEYFYLELFKTYSDAANFNYASYSTAYIKDAVVTDYSYSITSSAGTSSTAVAEGGTVTFTITRSGSGSASTVYWGTQGGTATAGSSDYQSLGISTLSFAANETSKTVTVSTNTDTLTEGTEYFWLNVYKTYTDATNFAYSSYGIAYIKDVVIGSDPGAPLAEMPPADSIDGLGQANNQTTTAVSLSYPGHSMGEIKNDSAFAALKSNGSVVTWGEVANGGDASAVAVQLNGDIDVTHIYSNGFAFAALRADGSVVTWGNANACSISSAAAVQLNGTVDVMQIYSTETAFAALRADGSVVTWGDLDNGGDSSTVASQLNGQTKVTSIYSTMSSFAALRSDGSVVTWGYSIFGGDSSAVASQLSGATRVTAVFSTGSAFAALRSDGSLVTWGSEFDGGNGSAVTTKINGSTDVVSVFATTSAFAALRTDGTIVAWGDANNGGDSSHVADQISGATAVVSVASTNSAFAALRADGSVVTWGNSGAGGDSAAVTSLLSGAIKVTKIFANNSAFAALRADGSVVTWGYDAYGGDHSQVSGQLDGSIDVQNIVVSDHAFAALRTDGSVVAWGELISGGDTSSVQSMLDGSVDVSSISSTSKSFAALRIDGSVTTWGDLSSGGDSTSVASQLSSVVSISDTTLITLTDTTNQTIVGTAANEFLIGGKGNDSIDGGKGNDNIDGGNGTDIASYSGVLSNYVITKTANGYTVSDLVAGGDGTDTLSNVERLQFANTKVALDIAGDSNAGLNLAGLADSGQVYRLYQAAFNRTPDNAGLAYWIGQGDSSVPLVNIASQFMTSSTEFSSKYGSLSNHQFIDQLYQNVLHRPGEASGVAYWYSQVDNTSQTRAQVLVGFSESAENQAAVIGVIQNGISYT